MRLEHLHGQRFSNEGELLSGPTLRRGGELPLLQRIRNSPSRAKVGRDVVLLHPNVLL